MAGGEAKNSILGAFAGHYDVKHVAVVDKDIDIHNSAEVEWAVAARFQADRDLVAVPESQNTWPTRSRWVGPTPPWPPAFFTSANSRFAKRNR